jgi:hypothetical protein
VSDPDFFHMLKEVSGGWQIAQRAAERARGGATAVLQLQARSHRAEVDRLESLGWKVHPVGGLEELVAFARSFSRARYGAEAAGESA